MKATEQYFPVGLFIILYKVVLPFLSVEKYLKCVHSIDRLKLLRSTFPFIRFNFFSSVLLGGTWLNAPFVTEE